MTLSPWLGTAGMILLWHIRSLLLKLIFVSVAFSPRLFGIGIHCLTLLSPLLKVRRMVLLSSLLWWELGTSLPGHGPGEWSSFRCVTSKQFWFWIVYNWHGKIGSDPVMHQSFVSPAPPTYGDSGANVRGNDLLSSPAVPGKCRACVLRKYTPMKFTLITHPQI